MSSVLLRPRWLALHVLAVACVIACLALTVWQFDRAESGNGRSLGYALQWPGFALFVVGVWAWLCRDAVRTHAGQPAPARPERVERAEDGLVLPPVRVAAADAEADADPELVAYNRMLARLNESDR